MITLALFKRMEIDKVAGLTANENFWWEEAPLQKDGAPAEGVWLITRGGDTQPAHKGLNLRTTVDFYVGFRNKVKTETVQAAISAYLRANPCFCELVGTVGNFNYDYKNIRIRPTQTPENAGATENGVIVKVASASIVYDLASE